MAAFTHLFVPGTINISQAVPSAMNAPTEDMRSAPFPDFTRTTLVEDVEAIFKNESKRVSVFSSSGAAWESAMTNALSPGDRVLMSRFGQFSVWLQTPR